uniref:NADH-ubiquinone oxidoreductase chain 2 n=1 Tax=Paradelma orientalis TaxID=592670 RepID=A0A7H1KA15_9SAUR|nr:NADH dehydrogenase subunit 2 [Paradelma orientalis]QNT21988.1 NADH dehydrogenase subunit 2 [Paradelma orientalis]QNT21992.1 NADH dehydrogenase subunit 2 [Paradelma orientalis]
MNPMTLTLLISSLTMGTIITVSSSHWLLAWAGLEMNTLAIIPIIAKQHHPRATEAATKYFFTQATASALIIFASTTNAWKTGQWDISQIFLPETSIMITLAIAMKLGLAPFHFWLPEVLQGSTLTIALLISTWQKLAPTALLFMTINNLNQMVLLSLGLTSTLIGGWMGLNQLQTRKIMAFSSIAHMGWMFTALSLTPNLPLLVLTIYLILTSATFMALMISSSKTLNDLGTSWSTSPTLLTITMLSLMSLGGLPPLTGFLPKWLVLKELVSTNLLILGILLALSTLPSLFFYLRMSHMTTLTLPPTTTNNKYKWRFTSNFTSLITPTIILATMILPISPLNSNLY